VPPVVKTVVTVVALVLVARPVDKLVEVTLVMYVLVKLLTTVEMTVSVAPGMTDVCVAVETADNPVVVAVTSNTLVTVDVAN